VNTPVIAAFARVAKENTLPTRVLEGQKTLISRTMHSLAYNSVNDEIVVNSPLAQAILTFRGDAKGEEPPIRVIQGSRTQIQGTAYDGNDEMAFDEVNGEIYIPVATSRGPTTADVLVFDRLANGNVAPKRVLGGPDTQIRGTVRGHPSVAVDAVHNFLIVRSSGEGNAGTALLIFDRTASGNARPLRVIRGPKTGIGGGGQPQVYGPKGWIVTGSSGGSLGVWSVNDNGDVPPRWRIPVLQLAGIQTSGITLNPMHKELIATSGARNRMVTFYFPEIFD
jgi:hypothetical protein